MINYYNNWINGLIVVGQLLIMITQCRIATKQRQIAVQSKWNFWLIKVQAIKSIKSRLSIFSEFACNVNNK